MSAVNTEHETNIMSSEFLFNEAPTQEENIF